MSERWSSEDGEPQGTAGAPMLQLLVSEGVTHAAAIVTRYFGGVKLGPGGLVRAYTAALKAALADAGVARVEEGVALRYRMDYPVFEKMKAAAARNGWTVADMDYEETVTFTVSGPCGCEEAVSFAAASAAGEEVAPLSVSRAELVTSCDA
jgi:putative IMPACT (imprinted ancient) family translation regulator